MDTDKERSEAVKDNAAYLKNAATRDQRCQDMKERYKRQSLATNLKSYGPKLAQTLSTFMSDEKANPLPSTDLTGAFDHSCVMLFNGSDGAAGSTIFGVVKDYQEQSATQVSAKVKSLKDFMSRNKDRTAAMTPVKHLNATPSSSLSDLPDLSVALKLIDSLGYEDTEGAAPWLSAVRAEKQPSSLTSAFPLPGIACLVQLCSESEAPVSFMLTPVKALLECGLTILEDFPRFCNNDAGNEAVTKTSLFITLQTPGQILYIPMGFLPTVVGRAPEETAKDKSPTFSTFWVKTLFCKHLAVALPHPEWVALHLLNAPYLQNLIGQRLFRERLSTFEKLSGDRAALQLGFEETPTLMDGDAETIALDEAKAAAEACKQLDAPNGPPKIVRAAAKRTPPQQQPGGRRDSTGKSPKSAAKPKAAPAS